MTCKEDIIASPIIQKILQEEGELPDWVDSPSCAIYWAWINDTKFYGSFDDYEKSIDDGS